MQCNISDYSDSTQKKSDQREKNERKRAWQEAVTGCQGRDTLVDLREHMPNATNVIQVADCNVRWLLCSVPSPPFAVRLFDTLDSIIFI